MILLTGASGFFGKIAYREFVRAMPTLGLCCHNDYNGQFSRVDLTKAEQCANVLEDIRPEVVVHSAAVRDPDLCEREPELARALHVECTCRFAEWCESYDAALVYISTDYVFDGRNPPYSENSAVNPLSEYGRTKAAGEEAARRASRHIVVRMPLQYGFSEAQDDSFVLKVLAAIQSSERREIDDVQMRYPTLSDDVAQAVIALLRSGFTGTIHMCGPTRATRFRMWKMIAETFELDAGHIMSAPQPVHADAERPRDSRLDLTLYESLGLPSFHGFAAGLRRVRSQMETAGYDWRTC